MADEQFHEFHLDGKQLVFLFMASTVVAVVIFLCGVMVGRGVRANKTAETVEATAGDPSDPTGGGQTTDASASPVATATTAAPADTADDPTNPTPEEKAPIVSERPRDTATREPVSPPPGEAAKVAAKATDRKEAAPQAADVSRQPAKSGFSVQVMTVTRQSDADAAVRKLKANGYDAFALPIGEGRSGFRVRVGNYKTRREAERAKARLEKVEKYKKAWVPPR